MANTHFFEPFYILYCVPSSNIWKILGLATQIRKFAKLLHISLLSELLNCLFEFIRKDRPYRPNCPSERWIIMIRL
jgi:hypothetical protein